MKSIKVIIIFVIALQSCNSKARITFWAKQNISCETYSVHIGNTYIGEVNTYYEVYPGCTNDDLLHHELKPGTYEITINDGCEVLTKNITLSKKECYMFEVN